MKLKLFVIIFIFYSTIIIAQNTKTYTVHLLKIEYDSLVSDNNLKDTLANQIKRAFSSSPKFKLLDLKNLGEKTNIDIFLSAKIVDYVFIKQPINNQNKIDTAYSISFSFSLDYIDANTFQITKSYLKNISSFQSELLKGTINIYDLNTCKSIIYKDLWPLVKECTRNIQLLEGEVKSITKLNEKGNKAKELDIIFPDNELPIKGEKFEIYKILKTYDYNGRKYNDIEEIGKVRYEVEPHSQAYYKVTSGESDIKEAIDAGSKLICKRYFSWYEAR